jgi:hypothetical protein
LSNSETLCYLALRTARASRNAQLLDLVGQLIHQLLCGAARNTRRVIRKFPRALQ